MKNVFVTFFDSLVMKMQNPTGNLGNMPLIIIPAICNEKGSPFGDPETCEKYGLGYVALSMAVCNLFLINILLLKVVL